MPGGFAGAWRLDVPERNESTPEACVWRLDISPGNESTPEACVKVAGGHAGGVATGLQGMKVHPGRGA